MKTIEEMTKIMLAFDKGEQIQILDKRGIWEDIRQPSWNWAGCDYRVKPKTYIPFDTAEEFLAAQRVRGEIVEDKKSGKRINLYVNKNGTIVGTEFLSNIWIVSNLQNIFRCYQFKDGTPCGKEVKT